MYLQAEQFDSFDRSHHEMLAILMHATELEEFVAGDDYDVDVVSLAAIMSEDVSVFLFQTDELWQRHAYDH